jgi:hypothetical protein
MGIMMTNWQDILDKIHADAAEAPRYRDDVKRLSDAHVRLTQVVMELAGAVRGLVDSRKVHFPERTRR